MKQTLLALALAVAILACGFLAAFIYTLPPVHDRLAWRVENLRAQIHYYFKSPQEQVFIPQEQVEAIVQATLQAPLSTPSQSNPTVAAPTPTAWPTPPSASLTDTPAPSAAPTPQETPIPSKVILNGIVHEYQKMNNCGPATLAMALTYWGWQGDQRDTRAYLRPNFATVDDKNVSPQEMVTYVERFSGLKALVRVGGEVDLLKRLIAAGFPVIIEKGFQPPKEDWMGHYEVLNGYDDQRQRFIAQDSYIMPDFPLPYADLEERWWRDFNYVYLVIYPPQRENQVLNILGPHAIVDYNYQYAAQKALDEIQRLNGRDLFFAWFNRGTNLTALENYAEAAQAYDQAFTIYASLKESERPWRVLWYQFGPYQAYYASGRYQDVIRLANTTLSFLARPVLEEALYWRGLAKAALGDEAGAIADLTKAAKLNPNFTPAVEELQRRGLAAP